MSYPTSGYSNIPTPGNPRATEAWALTEAARRIATAQAAGDEDALLTAIRLNWRLWTIFQAELSSGECQLPLDLRQNMLSLSNFVDKTTVDIIADPGIGKAADILVTINRHIAAGLFSIPSGEAPAPGTDAATTGTTA